MNAGWVIASGPTREHECWARGAGFVFASSGWANVVAALGAEPLYAWDPSLGLGLMVPVFRRYGLRVGFFGFPVVSAPLEMLEHARLIYQCRHFARGAGLDVVRLTRSMNEANDATATAVRPEVWIADLQAWSADGNKRLRKDLAFARRASTGLQLANTCDAKACFRLYADTVRSHAGKLRYNVAYFERLWRLAESTERVKLFAAVEPGIALRGFAALVVDGSTAYYLHGAVDEVGKRQGVSDLLLDQLVSHARSQGAQRLSFMASPWDQPGLLKFKRKWSDRQGLSLTYDLAGSRSGAIVRLASRWLARQDRAAAVRCVERTDGTESRGNC